MCFGVTAGAYILTLFAVCASSKLICYIYSLSTITCYWMMFSLLQSKYRERVLGLILVSPICKGPTWTEWLYSKVAFLQMALCSSGLHIYQNHMTMLTSYIVRWCPICCIIMGCVGWWRSAYFSATSARLMIYFDVIHVAFPWLLLKFFLWYLVILRKCEGSLNYPNQT